MNEKDSDKSALATKEIGRSEDLFIRGEGSLGSSAVPENPYTQKAMNTWAFVVLMWAIYRYLFKSDLPIWLDEFIIKPTVFFTPIYIFFSAVKHQGMFEGLWLKFETIKSDILYGLFVGAILFISGGAINFIKYQSILPPNSVLSTGSLFVVINTLSYYFLLSFATSTSEETLSRGFLLKHLYEDSGSILQSILYGSFLAIFVRIPILFTSEIFGIALLQVLLTDFILNITVSFIFLRNESLNLPIIIHTIYSLSLYIFLV